jgi:hypothetical protein
MLDIIIFILEFDILITKNLIKDFTPIYLKYKDYKNDTDTNKIIKEEIINRFKNKYKNDDIMLFLEKAKNYFYTPVDYNKNKGIEYLYIFIFLSNIIKKMNENNSISINFETAKEILCKDNNSITNDIMNDYITNKYFYYFNDTEKKYEFNNAMIKNLNDKINIISASIKTNNSINFSSILSFFNTNLQTNHTETEEEKKKKEEIENNKIIEAKLNIYKKILTVFDDNYTYNFLFIFIECLLNCELVRLKKITNDKKMLSNNLGLYDAIKIKKYFKDKSFINKPDDNIKKILDKFTELFGITFVNDIVDIKEKNLPACVVKYDDGNNSISFEKIINEQYIIYNNIELQTKTTGGNPEQYKYEYKNKDKLPITKYSYVICVELLLFEGNKPPTKEELRKLNCANNFNNLKMSFNNITRKIKGKNIIKNLELEKKYKTIQSITPENNNNATTEQSTNEKDKYKSISSIELSSNSTPSTTTTPTTTTNSTSNVSLLGIPQNK